MAYYGVSVFHLRLYSNRFVYKPVLDIIQIREKIISSTAVKNGGFSFRVFRVLSTTFPSRTLTVSDVNETFIYGFYLKVLNQILNSIEVGISKIGSIRPLVLSIRSRNDERKDIDRRFK